MSLADELKKLNDMHTAGEISSDELGRAKDKLLAPSAEAREAGPKSFWRSVSAGHVALGAIALAAIGFFLWQHFGAEPEPDPMLSLVSFLVVAFCLKLMRPFGGGAFGGDFGGAEEAVFPLAAIITIGAVVLAGGAFLIGLPLIAIGLAVFAVIGVVMWSWNALFGD